MTPLVASSNHVTIRRAGHASAWPVVLVVVLLHILIFVLYQYSLTLSKQPRKTRITIELSGSLPPAKGRSQGDALQHAAPVIAEPQAKSGPPEPPTVVVPEPSSSIPTPPLPIPAAKPPPASPTAPVQQVKPSPAPALTPKPVPTPEPTPKATPPQRSAPSSEKSQSGPTGPSSQGSTQPQTSSATSTAPLNPDGLETAHTADADYKASSLNNPKPPYPQIAFQMRIEGTVMVRALVQPDGSCGEVVLARSSGNDLLDRSALTTVAKWKFTPARSQGKNVAQWVNIPINFNIKRP